MKQNHIFIIILLPFLVSGFRSMEESKKILVESSKSDQDEEENETQRHEYTRLLFFHILNLGEEKESMKSTISKNDKKNINEYNEENIGSIIIDIYELFIPNNYFVSELESLRFDYKSSQNIICRSPFVEFLTQSLKCNNDENGQLYSFEIDVSFPGSEVIQCTEQEIFLKDQNGKLYAFKRYLFPQHKQLELFLTVYLKIYMKFQAHLLKLILELEKNKLSEERAKYKKHLIFLKKNEATIANPLTEKYNRKKLESLDNQEALEIEIEGMVEKTKEIGKTANNKKQLLQHKQTLLEKRQTSLANTTIKQSERDKLTEEISSIKKEMNSLDIEYSNALVEYRLELRHMLIIIPKIKIELDNISSQHLFNNSHILDNTKKIQKILEKHESLFRSHQRKDEQNQENAYLFLKNAFDQIDEKISKNRESQKQVEEVIEIIQRIQSAQKINADSEIMKLDSFSVYARKILKKIPYIKAEKRLTQAENTEESDNFLPELISPPKDKPLGGNPRNSMEENLIISLRKQKDGITIKENVLQKLQKITEQWLERNPKRQTRGILEDNQSMGTDRPKRSSSMMGLTQRQFMNNLQKESIQLDKILGIEDIDNSSISHKRTFSISWKGGHSRYTEKKENGEKITKFGHCKEYIADSDAAHNVETKIDRKRETIFINRENELTLTQEKEQLKQPIQLGNQKIKKPSKQEDSKKEESKKEETKQQIQKKETKQKMQEKQTPMTIAQTNPTKKK